MDGGTLGGLGPAGSMGGRCLAASPSCGRRPACSFQPCSRGRPETRGARETREARAGLGCSVPMASGERGAWCSARGGPDSALSQHAWDSKGTGLAPRVANPGSRLPPVLDPWWVGAMSICNLVVFKSRVLKEGRCPPEEKAWDPWAPQPTVDLLGTSWQTEPRGRMLPVASARQGPAEHRWLVGGRQGGHTLKACRAPTGALESRGPVSDA